MRLTSLLAVGLVLITAVCAFPQEDGVIKSWDFEADVEDWVTPDSKGEIGRTDVKEAVYKGQWSLEFKFPQRGIPEGETGEIPGIFAVPLPDGAPALQTVSFAVATAFSVPLIVAIDEEDGSSYSTIIWSQAGQWNECVLQLADFRLGDDSSDENAKLDPDQVKSLAFGDGSLFMRMIGEAGVPIYVPPAQPMRIWMDELVLSSKEPEKPDVATEEDKTKVVIDKCDDATIKWLVLGGDDLSLKTVTPEDDEAKYLEIGYLSPAGKLFACVRPITVGSLADCTSISFEVKVEMDAQLFLNVEDTREWRYSTVENVQAKPDWQRIEIPLASMQAEADSGAQGQVDASKIKQFVIADVKAMLESTISANTWSVRNVTAHK